MNPSLFESHSPLQGESRSEFSNRYKGYGEGLYAYLETNDKPIYDKLEFFKSRDNAIKDSYALYTDEGKTVAIQLDPDCQMIIIWDEEIQKEYGTWDDLNYETIHKFLISII